MRRSYLHPELFDPPEEKNVLFVQHPEMIEGMKAARAKHQEHRRN